MKFNNNYQLGNNVKIGANVKIGDRTVIYDNVVIGDGTIICNDCVLGEPLGDYYHNERYSNPGLVIGGNSLIRSHAIIYAGCKIGDHFQTGHRVTIREYTEFGCHCSVGTLSDIQGRSRFGDYCRLHSNVHIGQNSRIGNFVFIYPYVIFTNDPTPPSNLCEGPTIGDYTQIATAAVIFPSVVIGENCLIGANSAVTKNVADYSVVVGNPAKFKCDIREVRSKEKDGNHYPWMNNFERGMPWEGVGYKKWREK